VINAFTEELQDFVALAQGRGKDAIIARGAEALRLAEIVEAVYRGSQGEKLGA
jgi:hypothetical protein